MDTGMHISLLPFWRFWIFIIRSYSVSRCFWYRGYQKVGENITKGKPDMHEAIDVS